MKYRQVILAGILVLVVSAVPVQGQTDPVYYGPDPTDPAAAQGFATSSFLRENIDHINLYNLQLTVPVPLGPTYPIGPKLNLQLYLTYNSRPPDYVWTGRAVYGGPYYLRTGDPAVGLNWTLTLGAIKPCAFAKDRRGTICYYGPDGSQHPFPWNPSYSRARDGSQLVLNRLTNNGYEMWDGDGNYYEFTHIVGDPNPADLNGPNPLYDDPPSDYYNHFGRGRDGAYLKKVTDPYGKFYEVDYTWPTGNTPCWTEPRTAQCYYTTLSWSMVCGDHPTSWVPHTITLPSGQITFNLTDPGKLIHSIDFPVFANGQGSTATWTLGYQKTPLPAFEQICGEGNNRYDYKLQTITFPDSIATYAFSYGGGAPPEAPRLTSMTLPTGATVQYTWSQLNFYHGRSLREDQPDCPPKIPPVGSYMLVAPPPPGSTGGTQPNSTGLEDCDYETGYLDREVFGVTQRIQTVGGQQSTTDYQQLAFPYGLRGTSNASEAQSMTIVTYPANVDGVRHGKTVLFHSTKKGGYGHSSPGDRVGADVEEAVFDSDPRYLHATVNGTSTVPGNAVCPNAQGPYAFCPQNAVRVTLRTFDYSGSIDPTGVSESGDRRLKSQGTCYGNLATAGGCSNGKTHDTVFSLNPGSPVTKWATNGGHYDIEQHSGTLGNDSRTITTTWIPPTTAPSSSVPWLPNLASQVVTQGGTSSFTRYFQFDTKGFQTGDVLTNSTGPSYVNCRSRTSLSGQTDSADTQVVEYSAAVSGGSQPADYCTQYASSFNNISAGGTVFGKVNRFLRGRLISSRFVNQVPGTSTFKTVDRTLDTTTGWVKVGRSSAGHATTYTYDSIGRILRAVPPAGELPTQACYDSTTITRVYRTDSTSCSELRDNLADYATRDEYEFDALGRKYREFRLMPGATTVKRFRAFDPSGNEYFQSEWVGAGASQSLPASPGCANPTLPNVPNGTFSFCFDPLGRPGHVVGPSLSSHQILDRADGTDTYSDTRLEVTTKCINGTLNSDGSCTAYVDGNGAAMEVENPSTVRIMDAFGRLTKVTEPTSDVTEYSYDINGNLIKVAAIPQGGGAAVQLREFTYDLAGNLLTEKTPETLNSQTTYTYGALGKVLTESQPGTAQVATSYDFAGRVSSITSGSKSFLSNVYDATTGRLETQTAKTFRNGLVSSPSTIVDTFTYDGSHGRVASQTTNISAATGYSLETQQGWGYNRLGLVARHRYPRRTGSQTLTPSTENPFVVDMVYDAGVVVAHTVNGMPLLKDVQYAPSGAVTGYAAGNNTFWRVSPQTFQTNTVNLYTTITMDLSGLARPRRFQTQGAVSATSGDFSYDGSGNISQIGKGAWYEQGDWHQYDSLSRLLKTTVRATDFGTLFTEEFNYDRYGNLWKKKNADGGVLELCDTTCASNRLAVGTYDARGNVLSYQFQGSNNSYGYDELGRRTDFWNGAADGQGTYYDYVFDGKGERVAKLPGTNTPFFTLRDAGKRVVTEYLGTTRSRDNLYLGSLLVASFSNSQYSGESAWHVYSSDHLGSPRVVADVSGASVTTPKYWPYGNEFTSPASSQRLRFALMERETNELTDLYHNHARSHSLHFGRFISPDFVRGTPEDPQTWNRYAYSRNNPLKYTDPDGNVFKLFTGALRIGRALYKGQDLYSTVSGVVTAARTVVSLDPSVGTGTRLLATGSLLLELSGVSDVTNAIKGLKRVERVADAADDAAKTGRKISNDQLLAPPSKRGNAPIGSDGFPVELHHRGQSSDSTLDELTRTEHRLGDNFKKNHGNTGQEASQIDRKEFDKTRRQYWDEEWDSGRFTSLFE